MSDRGHIIGGIEQKINEKSESVRLTPPILGFLPIMVALQGNKRAL
jgi:hypothetical protein